MGVSPHLDCLAGACGPNCGSNGLLLCGCPFPLCNGSTGGWSQRVGTIG
jgi:hypothetical protein